jgi:hypothetical protein
MLEQDIIKALLNKEAYDKYRKKVPAISDGMKPWFDTLDAWYETKESSLTPEELHALHVTRHPAATNSAKMLMDVTLERIIESKANPEVVMELIETKYNQDKYTAFADKFIKLSEGSTHFSLQDIEAELREFNNQKATEHQYEPFVITAQDMLDATVAQGKWKFNLPIWQEKIGGIGPGVFGLFAARPNAGKSLAAIFSCFGPDGWMEQGARIFYLGNEEHIRRTKHRAICSWKGINYHDSTRDKRNEFIAATDEFNEKYGDKIAFFHKTGLDYSAIEDIIKEHKSDIVIIDQLDKLHVPGDQDGHIRLRKLYTTMRENATNLDTAIMGVSQASDEASGKKFFGFESLEGSKTGKGAELDLCICIGAENIRAEEGSSGGSEARFFNIAKNKLTGWEGVGGYMIDKQKSQMRG